LSLSTKSFLKLKKEFIADYCKESESLKVLKKIYKEKNYLVDPHTAVAKVIADRYNDKTKVMLIASTAHYAKFPEAIFEALNIKCPDNLKDKLLALQKINSRNKLHSELINIDKKPIIHKNEISTDLDELKDLIYDKLKEFHHKN